MTDKEITKIIGKAKWTRSSDGLIDVAGDVYLDGKRLKELPLRFGTVTGNFYCYHNQLTSLAGAPAKVGGSFGCSFNQLTTLAGLPDAQQYWIDSDQQDWLTKKPEPQEWQLRRL